MTSSGFSADPFDLTNASIRAGTTDRDELARILGVAYTEGKLDDDEYRERLDAALQIKLLGEARSLLIDLGNPEILLYRDLPKKESKASLAKEQHARLGSLVDLILFTAMINMVWSLTSLSSGKWQYYWPMWPMFGVGIAVVAEAVSAYQTSATKQRRIIDGEDEPTALKEC